MASVLEVSAKRDNGEVECSDDEDKQRENEADRHQDEAQRNGNELAVQRVDSRSAGSSMQVVSSAVYPNSCILARTKGLNEGHTFFAPVSGVTTSWRSLACTACSQSAMPPSPFPAPAPAPAPALVAAPLPLPLPCLRWRTPVADMLTGAQSSCNTKNGWLSNNGCEDAPMCVGVCAHTHSLTHSQHKECLQPLLHTRVIVKYTVVSHTHHTSLVNHFVQ